MLEVKVKKVTKLAFVEYVEKASLAYFQKELISVKYKVKEPTVILYVSKTLTFEEVSVFIVAIQKNFRIELPSFKVLPESILITLKERSN